MDDNFDTFPENHGDGALSTYTLSVLAWKERLRMQLIESLKERRVKHLDTSVIIELLNIE